MNSHWASMPSDERMCALMRGTENAKSQAELQVGLMLKKSLTNKVAPVAAWGRGTRGSNGQSLSMW